MSEKIQYAGEVNEKGKLTLYQQKTFKLDVHSKFGGQLIWLTVEKRSQRVSTSQRGYLFGVILPRYRQALKREQGFIFTDGETKTWAEEQFLSDVRLNLNGEKYNATRSISELGKHEMTELIDTLIIFAATELSEIIPYPDEK